MRGSQVLKEKQNLFFGLLAVILCLVVSGVWVFHFEQYIETFLGGNRPYTRGPILTAFKLTSSQLKSFHQRRREPKTVTLDVSGLSIDLKAFAGELPEHLAIPLPGEGAREFARQHVDFKDSASFVWVGKAAGHQFEMAFLSFYEEALVGVIETRRGSYQIKYLAPGQGLIRRIDSRQFPTNVDDVISSPSELLKEGEGTRDLAAIGEGELPGVPRVVLDIVIGYSHLVEDIERGERPTLALINLMLANANHAFRRSETGVELHLRETVRLEMDSTNPYDAIMGMKAAYQEISFHYDEQNPYHILLNRRIQARSDLVTLLTDVYGSNLSQLLDDPSRDGEEVRYCGMSNVINEFSSSESGMSVVAAPCPPWILAHEVGHNLGCEHDRANVPPERKERDWILPYAFGFRPQDREGNQWHTIMAYDCEGCAAIFEFSNPDHIYFGIPIGEVNRTDNARAIRQRAHTVQRIFTGHDAPRILRQSQDVRISEGGQVTLSLTALAPPSAPIVEYRWYRGNTLVAKGADQRTLTLDERSYWGSFAVYQGEAINEYGRARTQGIKVYFPE